MKRTGAAPVPFWTFSLGQGLAAAGETATLTALTLHLQASGGTALVTALLLCSFVPGVLLASPASRIFDRWAHGRVLMGSLTLRVALTVLVAGTLEEPTAALAIYALMRCVSVPETPALLATGPALSPREWPTQTVYSRLAISRNIGAVAGPAAAGALVAPLGGGGVLLFDAAACAVLLISLLLTRPRRQGTVAPRGLASTSPRYRLRDLVLQSPAAPYVGVLALAIVFTAALPVAQSAYFNDELRVAPADFGLIIAAYATGRLIAALVGSVTAWPKSSAMALIAATVGLGVSIAAVTFLSTMVAIVLVFGTAGYCNTLQVLSIRTIVHDATAERHIPQAFTALGAINNSATLAGIIGGGAFVAVASGQLALQAAGVATALIGLVGAGRALMARRSGGTVGR